MHSTRATASRRNSFRAGLAVVGVLVALTTGCSTDDPRVKALLDAFLNHRPPSPPPSCPASCDDGNACTIDSCGPATGYACSNAPAEPQPCSDGLTCTVNDRCDAGACRGEVLVCAAGTCSEPAGCPAPPVRSCQESSWAQMLPGSTGGGLAATFHSAATNDIGEVVVGGSIWGDIVLPMNVPVSSPAGDSNLLLAKINPGDGSVAWAKAFGDSSHRQTIRKVAVNNGGVVGFSGELLGTIDLGNGVTVGPPVPPPADQRPQFWTGTFFAGVRSSDGSGVFAVDLGFAVGAVVDLAASPTDRSFVLCGSTVTTGAPVRDRDSYVAKFSASGELLWNASPALAAGESDSCDSLVVLDDGDVVFAGLHGYGPTRALRVTKLDGSTGAQKWAKTFALGEVLRSPPDTAIALVNDIAADANGDLALAGTLWGRIELGGSVGTLLVPGTDDHATFSSDAMVFKLDGDSGEPLWGRLFGDPGTGVVPWEEGRNIDFDASGDVHTTVNTRTPEPTSTGYYDLIQLKLGGATGSTLCTRTYDGEEGQVSGELVINRRGNGSARDQAVLLGYFTKIIDFGDGTVLRAPFDLAYFLMRFYP